MQGMPGMGGMGGGMGGMPQAPPQMPPQQNQPATLPADQRQDLDQAEALKQEANNLYKLQNYEEACTKYFSAINQIRLNTDLAKTKVGKEAEMACRSNLAQCKLNLKDYDHVIDQCERVIDYDTNNIKANFRMSQAAFALS